MEESSKNTRPNSKLDKNQQEFIQKQKAEILQRASQGRGLTLEDILSKVKKEDNHHELEKVLDFLPAKLESLEEISNQDELLREFFTQVKMSSFNYTKSFLEVEITKEEERRDLGVKNILKKNKEILNLTKQASRQEVVKWSERVLRLGLNKDFELPDRQKYNTYLHFLESLFLTLYINKEIPVEKLELEKDPTLNILKATPKTLLYRKILQDINSFQKEGSFKHLESLRLSLAEALAKTFLKNREN